jgi:hypothetical protein
LTDLKMPLRYDFRQEYGYGYVADELFGEYVEWDDYKDLIDWHTSVAINPSVSRAAQELYEKGYDAGHEACSDMYAYD